MKLYLTTLCLLISTTSFSAINQTIMPVENFLNTLKKSPLGLEVELDSQLTKDETNSVNGTENALAINFQYEIFDSQQLNVSSEISYKNIKEEKGESNLEFIEIGYSKDFSIELIKTSLTSSLYYQYPINSNTRNDEMQNGSINLLLESESEISSNFAIEGEMQFTRFFNTSKENEVVSRTFNVQINPIYNISDSLSFKLPINSSFEFNKGNSSTGYLNTAITPTIGYSFNSDIELEAYTEFTPFNSYDGNVLTSNFEKEAVYGATLTYGVF